MILLLAALLLSPVDQIKNQIIIHDYRGASDTARSALNSEPHTPDLLAESIKAFARNGDEELMHKAYKEWTGSEDQKRLILEEMSWGVIHKGAQSSKPMIRLMSALASFLSQDAKGITQLCSLINDPNAIVRGVTAEVAGQSLDEPLREAVLKRFQVEREWDVRIALIRDLGSMKIKAAKPLLEDLVSQEGITMEERGSAVEALVALMDGSPRQEIERLKNSNRAALRDLCAQVITYFQEKRDEDILLELMHDPRAEVRASAWQGLGLLKTPTEFTGLLDPDFSVQLASAYHHLATGSQPIDSWYMNVMNSGTKKEKRQAAGLTRITGQRGKQLAAKYRSYSQDPFVRLNLSLALLDKAALDTIYDAIINRKEKWMEDENGIIKYVTESSVTHRPTIPNYPEVVDKNLRLECINILAIKEHPKALDACRQFLKDPNWGIVGITSALLLTEGDDSAVELVKSLLNDPDPNIQLQAALILVKWDPQEKLLPILKEKYDTLPIERKEVVIEAIGDLEDPEAIEFLVRELGATRESVRIIAAASILKTLYD